MPVNIVIRMDLKALGGVNTVFMLIMLLSNMLHSLRLISLASSIFHCATTGGGGYYYKLIQSAILPPGHVESRVWSGDKIQAEKIYNHCHFSQIHHFLQG